MARVSYLFIQTYKEKQNEQEKLRGTFQILDGNILMLVHPSSGDNLFYKSEGCQPYYSDRFVWYAPQKKRIGRTILLRRKDEM